MDIAKLRQKEERLQEQLAKIKKEYAAIKSQRSEQERKERTQQLIQLGGIVRMVLGKTVDKGILAGLLMKNKGYFTGELTSEELKMRGDALISEREAEIKAKRNAGKSAVSEVIEDAAAE